MHKPSPGGLLTHQDPTTNVWPGHQWTYPPSSGNGDPVILPVIIPTPPRPTERRPHRCPVCMGAGQVEAHLYAPMPIATATNMPMVACRSCVNGIIWG